MKIIFADIILITHFLFILFVVMGQGLIVLGAVRRWKWIRNHTFRSAHLASIFLVAVQAWLGRACPLTVLEVTLRKSAGQPVYSGSFVEYWVNRMIYYDFPEWIFLMTYTVFGLIVFCTWIVVRPEKT